jgi:hypothetical protein
MITGIDRNDYILISEKELEVFKIECKNFGCEISYIHGKWRDHSVTLGDRVWDYKVFFHQKIDANTAYCIGYCVKLNLNQLSRVESFPAE